MNRDQNARQLIYLLGLTGALGGSASAFGSAVLVENFLASGKTFPIAAVLILDGPGDGEIFGRYDVQRFRISVAGGPVTEAQLSQYLASGGALSSQVALEQAISSIQGYFGNGPLIASEHGLQGYIAQTGKERLVVAQAKTFVVADLDVIVTDETFAPTYDPPYQVTGSVVSGLVTLSWTPPPSRFDTISASPVVVYRGTNGGAYPSAPGVGTPLTPGSGPPATDRPGSGTWPYSLFAIYDPRLPGPPSSEQDFATAQITVVVP